MEGGRGSAAGTEGFAGGLVTWFGAYMISFVGLLHLLEAGEHLGYAVYIGVLFLANFAGAAVAALGILWTGGRWAWLLGAAVAGGALLALAWSRVFGLPGYPDGVGQWFNLLAWMAVAFELSFLAAVPLAVTSRGRALVGAEQHRIDREKVPPASHETPEHFGLIEKEMGEVRARMEPDLSNLRASLNPRTLGGQTKRNAQQSARARVRSLLHRVRESKRR